MNKISDERRQAILEMWKSDLPICEIAWKSRICVPTVRRLVKEAGLFPRQIDKDRKLSGNNHGTADITPEEVEQRRAEVEASWTESQRRCADQLGRHERVSIRMYRTSGGVMEGVR